eukprot:TRINITY_DN30672_c0_g1_i1.p1 TRINITY_DN30672_c0_g1~~TRINITY_DN30672_c0_g1_i1.p1  ORF type:complete len:326 (-),score=73.93 TRINITY_DN30672_c0_g1_i1:49-1026(-)
MPPAPVPMIVVSPDVFAVSQHKKTSPGVREVTYEELSKACDDWSLSKLLGYGASGTAYKGHLGGYGQVAVKRFKELSAGEDGSAALRRSYTREIEALQQIRHPNIIELLAFADDGPEVCLVTPLMEGGSLEAAIRSGMRWWVRAQIASQITCALGFLHNCCRLHRDVKSSNILLDKSRLHARLADFGLSGDVLPTGATTGVTGSLPYMAPELLRCKPFSEKSDVFALGVVYLELLTGLSAMDHKGHPEQPLLVDRASDVSVSKELCEKSFKPWPKEQAEMFADLASKALVQEPSERCTVAQLESSDELRAINGAAGVAEISLGGA